MKGRHLAETEMVERVLRIYRWLSRKNEIPAFSLWNASVVQLYLPTISASIAGTSFIPFDNHRLWVAVTSLYKY